MHYLPKDFFGGNTQTRRFFFPQRGSIDLLDLEKYEKMTPWTQNRRRYSGERAECVYGLCTVHKHKLFTGQLPILLEDTR